MIQDLSKYVGFLVEHGITPNQFLLPYCLYLDEIKGAKDGGRRYRQTAGDKSAIANLYIFTNSPPPNGGWSKSEMQDLVEKGFILNKNQAGNWLPDLMYVTPKFINAVFATEAGFDEFFEAYPAYAKKGDGQRMALKVVSEAETKALYNQKVVTLVEHNRIMAVLKWAEDRARKGDYIINFKITSFLEARLWRDLEKLMVESEAPSLEETGMTKTVGRSDGDEEYDFGT